jgi:ATP-binding cassette subfamily B (MDR/TAP) protein 1
VLTLFYISRFQSALDNESEKIVQAAIDNLVGGKSAGKGITTIIIAHRLSTVRSADRIVVLGASDGSTGSTIVEMGSHDELMKKENGLYKALVGGTHDDHNKSGIITSDIDSSAVYGDSVVSSANYGNSVVKTSISMMEEKEYDADSLGSTVLEEDSLEEEEDNKEVDKDFKNIDKKRLNQYSEPERYHFIVGLFACFCTGLAFPVCGLLFSLMLSSMVLFDYEVAIYYIRLLAGAFGLLAFFMVIAQFFQTYLFEIIGERMTRRIRTDYFRALLRQNIGWFDMPQNALGVLTSRLAVDIKLIRLCVGQGTGATVSSMTSLLVGFVVSMIAAWQFALAFLATVPLLALTEAINWMLMKGGDSTSKKKLGEISGLFGEYVQGIREVQSFSLETHITSTISELLQADILEVSKRAAFLRGVSAGSVQIIQLGVYALAFYIGAKLMDNGLLDYESFNLVLWSMAFGASGMGQAAK